MLIAHEDNADMPFFDDLCLKPHTDPPQTTLRHKPKEFSLCGEETTVVKEGEID